MSEMVERREILFRSITNCMSEALGLGLECYNVYVRRTDGASNTLRSSSDDDDADSLEMERKKAEGRGWWWRLFEAREGDQFKESSTDKTEKRKNEKKEMRRPLARPVVRRRRHRRRASQQVGRC